MITRLVSGRALALVAAAGIFAGGAATVGASGGVSGAAGNVNDVLSTLHITDRTPDQADAPIDDIQQPENSGKPGDVPPAEHGDGLSNAEEHANDNADHGLQNAAEGSDNAGQGIQNASDEGLDHANSHALDGPSADKDELGPPRPPLPVHADDHAAGGRDNGDGAATDAETDRHSSEGPDHTPGH